MISPRTPLIDSFDSKFIWRTNSVLFSTFKTRGSSKYSLLVRDGIVTKTLKLESGSSANGRAIARFILCECPVKSTIFGAAASSSIWTLFLINGCFLLNTIRLFAAPIVCEAIQIVFVTCQSQLSGGTKGNRKDKVTYPPRRVLRCWSGERLNDTTLHSGILNIVLMKTNLPCLGVCYFASCKFSGLIYYPSGSSLILNLHYRFLCDRLAGVTHPPLLYLAALFGVIPSFKQ